MAEKQQVEQVPAPFFEELYLDRIRIDEDKASNDINNTNGKKLKVLIVGGSMAGCCAAIALQAIGCEVQVFESSSFLRSQGAGLVIQPDMAAFVKHFNISRPEEVSVPSSGRQYVSIDGSIIGGNDNPQLFSAWDVLYRALRNKVPDEVYHASTKVIDVKVDETGVMVTTADGKEYAGDLVIGSDGPGSLIRSKLGPKDIESSYQGYVAWRGLCPEQEVPNEVLEFLATKFTVFQGENFHILAYLIPGEDGETTKGKRRVNWVWYWNTSQEELDRILVDKNGKAHGYSIPRGLLKDDIAEERRRIAKECLPPQLASLVQHTKDIFVQAIYDMLCPQLAFKDRVALVGDAGCILRPHTAAGTTKAAVNAWTLARCLQAHFDDVPSALRQYNDNMIPLAEYLVKVGVTIGTNSQFPSRGGAGG